MIYYITRYAGNTKDAGTKAPKDIENICEKNGWREIKFENPIASKNSIVSAVKKTIVNINNWIRLNKAVKDGDLVLYQHPMYFGTKFANKFIPLIQKKGVRFIALIHDLESLRNLTANTEKDVNAYKYADMILLKKFDYIIAHNQKMKEYLIQNDIVDQKVFCLDIFDYLCQTEFKMPKKEKVVDIAGNLDPKKSGYIYEFANKNSEIKVELFGANYENSNTASNIEYRGIFTPEEITGFLDGSFGIVWDGPTAEDCIGYTGAYLKYNNPHKTSMYLAAGIPVIVWEKAAIAQFVLENKIGIAVSSLEKLNDEIDKISVDRYEDLAKNARCVGKNLRDGWYFQTVMEHIFKDFSGENLEDNKNEVSN